MRVIKIILVVCIAIFILTKVFKNGTAELVLKSNMHHLLGFNVDIGKTDISLLSSKIDLSDVRILNPSDFEDRLMADMPRIYVDFDLKSLIKGSLHFNNIELNLRELLIVKNKDGKVNIKRTKPVKPKRSAKKTPSAFGIDRLELSIGKVVYKDYTHGEEPLVRTFNINLKKEVYKNVENLDMLVKAVVARALISTPIASLIDVGVHTLRKNLDDITKKGKRIWEKTMGEEGSEFLKKTEDLLKDALTIPSEKYKGEE